jgi:drug/metabolite transporter (DMT)-like permease
MLGGGLVLSVCALGFEPGAGAAMRFDWGLSAWSGWLFLVLFGSLVAFTAYLQLVRIWGTARAGAYAFVSPIVAVALGVAIFHEPVTRTDAAGMAIMLAGAWLTLRPVTQTG